LNLKCFRAYDILRALDQTTNNIIATTIRHFHYVFQVGIWYCLWYSSTSTTCPLPIPPYISTMMLARSARITQRLSRASGAARSFSSPAPTKAAEDGAVANPVHEKRQEMTKYDRHMVWGKTDKEFYPAPVLPENPAEIAALDPADKGVPRLRADGSERTVVIRQQKKSMRQAPLNPEASWKIYFYEDGSAAETKWTNPLMGWTSNSDPYQCAPPLTFETAEEAVYFAKKRGWQFVVKRPIMRFERRDDAQYQDNFLPQAVAAKIQKEGTSCDWWHRTKSGTSHYFRPLKYHGDGVVRQHGPNMSAPIQEAPEGYYKLR
jgi:hypothetical protein